MTNFERNSLLFATSLGYHVGDINGAIKGIMYLSGAILLLHLMQIIAKALKKST